MIQLTTAQKCTGMQQMRIKKRVMRGDHKDFFQLHITHHATIFRIVLSYRWDPRHELAHAEITRDTSGIDISIIRLMQLHSEVV
jgi:hypothetical protein